jgi:BASS family bile acid:Na+ symporter
VIEFLAAVSRISVFVFLVSSMTEIGLGLRLHQIVAPLRNVRLVVSILLANFIIAPLLALGIARLLRLDEPFALGLLLLGLGAGAPFMPKMAAMAKGDVALSVAILGILMVGTIIFLPIVLPLLVAGTEVHPGQIVQLLLLLILLPLTIGLLVKARARMTAALLAPVFGRVSTVALAATIVLIISLHWQSLLLVFGTSAIYAGLLFSACCSLTGWLLGGRDKGPRIAFSLGTGFRNFPAALIVSLQNFTDPNVSVMVIVTTLTALVVLLPPAWLMGKRGTAT